MPQCLMLRSSQISVSRLNSDRHSRYRNLLLILLVMLATSCSVPSSTGSNAPFLDIEVAASRLDGIVRRAINGDARSFDELTRSMADLDRVVAAADSVQGLSRWAPESAWNDLRNNLQVVVDARDATLNGFEAASKAVNYFRSAQQKLLEASRQATESGKAASRVYIMMDGVVILERLSANTSAFMTKGKDLQRTGDWMARDLANLNLSLTALQNGNEALAVKAESDEALRAKLKAVAEEVEYGNGHVASLLDATGVMEEVVAATSKISGQASLVADAARSARVSD